MNIQTPANLNWPQSEKNECWKADMFHTSIKIHFPTVLAFTNKPDKCFIAHLECGKASIPEALVDLTPEKQN